MFFTMISNALKLIYVDLRGPRLVRSISSLRAVKQPKRSLGSWNICFSSRMTLIRGHDMTDDIDTFLTGAFDLRSCVSFLDTDRRKLWDM